VRGASFTIFRAYGSIALTNRVDFLRGLVYPCLDPVDVLNCFDDLFIDRVHVVCLINIEVLFITQDETRNSYY